MGDVTYTLQHRFPVVAGTPIPIDDICRKAMYIYGAAFPVLPGDSLDVRVSPTSDGVADWITVQTLDNKFTDHLVPLDLVDFKRVVLAVTGTATFTSAFLLIERM